MATRKRSKTPEPGRSGGPSIREADSVEQPVPEEADGIFRVVGIGASAGGLEAFTSLVSALTDDTGMAFVAVPHLDPTHPSALSDILARSTPMPVVEIIDGQAIAPDTIYVLPPGQDLTIEDTTLELQPRSVGALHRPIDLFC